MRLGGSDVAASRGRVRLWTSRATPLLRLRAAEPMDALPNAQRPLTESMPSVWSVGALVRAVSEIVGQAWGSCVVRGEISGFSRAPSGHCYFNLKDSAAGASIRCAMFRRATGLLDFALADGQLIDVRGRLAVYEPRGELQLVVESARRTGDGALYEQFLRLRERLGAEGLFEAARKRALPMHPLRIGVVTSLAGAALHDITSTLGRRSPHVAIVVYPSAVQGTDAPTALCAAIAVASTRAEVELLIVARGGGSLQDLWAFNDERVARALAACRVPVVSGVGHETDVTLADLVADVRAATPTAAAEIAAPATVALLAELTAHHRSLRRRVAGFLDTELQRIDRLSLRAARPAAALRARAHALDLIAQRLTHSRARDLASRVGSLDALATRWRHVFLQTRQRRARELDALQGRLNALDPFAALARGYALLTDEKGHAVTSVRGIAVGQRLRAELQDGALTTRVDGIDAP